MNTVPDRMDRLRAVVSSAVAGVCALEVATLVAAWTRTPPHPPLVWVPFISACVAVGVVAVGLLRRAGTEVSGLATAMLFATVSLMVFGPHKVFTAGMPAILPAVVVGFGLEALVLTLVTRWARGRGRETADPGPRTTPISRQAQVL